MLNKKILIKIIAVIILLGGLIFFSDIPLIKIFREKIIKTASPAMQITTYVQKKFRGSANETLLAEKDKQLKVLEYELKKTQKENDALKTALSFKEEKGIPLKGSRVILYFKEVGRELLLLDKGENDGVKVGDLVVDAKNVLIGVVSSTENEFSKVDVASNAGETFEIEILGQDIRAVAEGLGARAFSIKLIPRDMVLNKGDFVSMINNQTRTLLLGEVASVESGGGNAFLDVKAVLLAKPETAQNVFIVTGTHLNNK